MTSPIGPVDFLILLTLVDTKRHGYGIRRDIQELTESAIVLDAGNLYRSIRRLMEAGLVERSDEDARRRYYRLTPRGRRIAAVEAHRMKGLLTHHKVRKLLAESAP